MAATAVASLEEGAPTAAYARVAERAVRYNAGNDPGSADLADYPTAAQHPPAAQIREQLHAQVADIQTFLRTIPDVDARTPDEILGYDDHGLPR